MKSTLIIIPALVLILIAGILVLPGAAVPAQAGQSCKSVSGLSHAVVPSSTPFVGLPADLWGGPLYLMLDGQFVPGLTIMSGNDGTDTWQGANGQGHDGLYVVGVNCTAAGNTPGSIHTCPDTFNIVVPHSTFTIPPGKAAMVYYLGSSAKIAGGTGIFLGATGNINLRGPAMTWADSSVPILGVTGRWSPELSGTICGVQ